MAKRVVDETTDAHGNLPGRPADEQGHEAATANAGGTLDETAAAAQLDAESTDVDVTVVVDP